VRGCARRDRQRLVQKSFEDARGRLDPAIFLGIVGYFLLKVGCVPAPLRLGFVLGPLLEEHLRRAMIISRGDPSIFFTRPISLALLIGAPIALVAAVRPGIGEKREEYF
jgi:putative tricarboxylic transport membrane protein